PLGRALSCRAPEEPARRASRARRGRCAQRDLPSRDLPGPQRRAALQLHAPGLGDRRAALLSGRGGGRPAVGGSARAQHGVSVAPAGARAARARGALSVAIQLADVRRAVSARPARRVSDPVTHRAAVALVLRETGEGLELLFIRRAEYPGDPWS